jgi:hypothetical protein
VGGSRLPRRQFPGASRKLHVGVILSIVGASIASWSSSYSAAAHLESGVCRSAKHLKPDSRCFRARERKGLHR